VVLVGTVIVFVIVAEVDNDVVVVVATVDDTDAADCCPMKTG